jgi:pyridoxine/pyridoxamine 5'-phosphate oxidase
VGLGFGSAQFVNERRKQVQAIQARYLGPTNTRGSRIKAWAEAGSVTIDYPHELSGQACYRKAAQALADKFKWPDKYLGAQLPGGDYVFVPVHPWSEE